jgi:hypothetical protein
MPRAVYASLMLLLLLVPSASAEPIVRAWMEAYDVADQPITSAVIGQPFQIRVFVEDLREPHGGVAVAFFASGYQSSLITPLGTPQIDNYFSDFLPLSLLNETVFAGGGVALEFEPNQLPGPGPQLLYSINFLATNLGEAEFLLAGPLSGDDLDWFVYYDDTPVPADQIASSGLRLSIVVPEPSSMLLATIASAALGLAAVRRRRYL